MSDILQLMLYIAVCFFGITAIFSVLEKRMPSDFGLSTILMISTFIGSIWFVYLDNKNQLVSKEVGCVEFEIDHVSYLEYKNNRSNKEYFFVKHNVHGLSRLEFDDVKPKTIDGKIHAYVFSKTKNGVTKHFQDTSDISCQIR